MAKDAKLQGRITEHEKKQVDKLIAEGVVFHESDAVREGIKLLLVKFEKFLETA